MPILSKFSTETSEHSADDEVRKVLKVSDAGVFANIINLLTVNNRYLKGHHFDGWLAGAPGLC